VFVRLILSNCSLSVPNLWPSGCHLRQSWGSVQAISDAWLSAAMSCLFLAGDIRVN
jgi:hypothetical protein